MNTPNPRSLQLSLAAKPTAILGSGLSDITVTGGSDLQALRLNPGICYRRTNLFLFLDLRLACAWDAATLL